MAVFPHFWCISFHLWGKRRFPEEVLLVTLLMVCWHIEPAAIIIIVNTVYLELNVSSHTSKKMISALLLAFLVCEEPLFSLCVCVCVCVCVQWFFFCNWSLLLRASCLKLEMKEIKCYEAKLNRRKWKRLVAAQSRNLLYVVGSVDLSVPLPHSCKQ